jgi:hypothetical protein
MEHFPIYCSLGLEFLELVLQEKDVEKVISQLLLQSFIPQPVTHLLGSPL